LKKAASINKKNPRDTYFPNLEEKVEEKEDAVNENFMAAMKNKTLAFTILNLCYQVLLFL
jgi:hypothetical protein